MNNKFRQIFLIYAQIQKQVEKLFCAEKKSGTITTSILTNLPH